MKGLRSDCPISFGLEIFGDQWSLLILRDIVFYDKSTYGEFRRSAEGISTNILADRLSKLCNAGLLAKSPLPHDARAFAYKLTAQGRALVPALYELMLWGIDHGAPPKELRTWAVQVRKNKKRAIAQKIWALSASDAGSTA